MEYMTIEEQLIELARRMTALRGASGRDDERDVVRETLRTIGRTAAFFGGFDGMTRLHNAVEEMTGNRNEIGDVLNRAWDGIGGWWS